MIAKNKLYKAKKQWFLDRIGKTIFRTRWACNCKMCESIYKNGLEINDELHAHYLHMVESECGNIKYFDTLEERDLFENNCINK